MATNLYKELLRDIVWEINEIALDKSIWEDSEFNRGYTAGMMVIMKSIQGEISAFNLPDSENPINLIDVDEWFRLGKDYQFPRNDRGE